MTNFTNDQLFNMTKDHAAPDWTNYAHLEIGGCIDANEDPSAPFSPTQATDIIGGMDRDTAQFFTVYGRLHADEHGVMLAEAITDCNTLSSAQEIAALFTGWTHLPVHLEC